jgi:hypothetical protein
MASANLDLERSIYAPRDRVLATTFVICVAAVLVGCGGGASSNGANSAEARFVALANAICDKTNTTRALSPPTRTELARLRSLARSARKAPRVATYLSDLSARRTLRTAMSNLSKKAFDLPHGTSYVEESYRLDVSVYTDAKALGLTSCIGRPPRKPIGG